MVERTRIVDLIVLQEELKEWLDHNFPNATADQQFKGIVEELGELAHADLKTEQNIRGYDAIKWDHEVKDAVGDIVIYLINWCNTKDISFFECLNLALMTIKNRDWIKNPKGE